MLSQDEMVKLAELTANNLASRRDMAFRISPEQHYQDHLAIRELVKTFDDRTVQALRGFVEAFDFATLEALKDLSRLFRTGRWVVLLVIAFIVGIGAVVYMVTHPAIILGKFF